MAAGHPMPYRADGSIDPRFGPGTQLGKYELIAPIGAGGMASVILARQRGPGGFEKVVVIKVVHPHLAQDEVAVNMLLDEGRLAALIDHPNVVHTYEIGEAHGTFYIVMEYLAGESLHTTIRNSIHPGAPQFHPYLAAKIVADACEGLHAAHELVDFNGQNRGIVHRDVSPGNVVVLYNGQVKVVDFGIAKAHGRVTSTQDGELKGKYGYMAPEQINNEPMDRRSDVFSLGVTLWEALAKRRLFQTDSVGATLMQVLQGPRISPSTYDANIPPELDHIAQIALQPDPRNRFPTAGDMKRAIDDVIWQSRVGATQIGQYMQTLFAERMDQRRRLLAAASEQSVDNVINLLTRQQQAVRPSRTSGQHDTPATPTPISIRAGAPVAARGSAPVLPQRQSHPVLQAQPPGSFRVPPDSGALVQPAPGEADELDDDQGDDEEEASNFPRYLVMFCALVIAVVGGIVIYARLTHTSRVQQAAAQAPVAIDSHARSTILDPSQLATAPTPTAAPSVPPPSTLDTGPTPVPGPTVPTTQPQAGTSPTVAPPPVEPTPPVPTPPVVKHPPVTSPAKPRGEDHVTKTSKLVTRSSNDGDADPAKPVKPNKSAQDKARDAGSLLATGDLDGAESTYKAALAIDSRLASAQRGLGIIYASRGENAKAVVAFKKYLKLSPAAPDAVQIQNRINKLSE